MRLSLSTLSTEGAGMFRLGLGMFRLGLGMFRLGLGTSPFQCQICATHAQHMHSTCTAHAQHMYNSVGIASDPLLYDFAYNVGLGVWLSQSAVNMLLGWD